MSLQTVLTRRLGLQHPIIQAPLAGGGDTPDLVAAVAEAGALGFIGAAYLTPPQIAEAARAVRARTARPFGINLFAPLPAPRELPDASPALERVAPFYAELGLAPPSIPASASGTFDDQLRAALESGASVFSFTFGVLPESARDAVKERGMFLIGTATTSTRPSRSKTLASRPSSRRAARPVATGERLRATSTERWWGRWPSCPRSSMPSRSP